MGCDYQESSSDSVRRKKAYKAWDDAWAIAEALLVQTTLWHKLSPEEKEEMQHHFTKALVGR